MIKCNYCDTLNEEGSVYCNKCGKALKNNETQDTNPIKGKEELQDLFQGNGDNIALSCLKLIGEGFKNPLAFIKNCRYASNNVTLIMAALTIIVSLINKVMLKNMSAIDLLSSISSYFGGSFGSIKFWQMLLIDFAFLLANIGVVFLMLSVMGKAPNIIDCVNIIIFSNVLAALLFFAGIIIAKISLVLGAVIILSTIVLYYFMLFNALTESLDVEEMKSVIIIAANSAVTVIIILEIFKLLVKSMFKGMY